MLLQTSDYEQFIIKDENRDLDRPHVARLKRSIEKENLLAVRPILVNELMEVLDGQHRLEAARQLGVPVYYQVLSGSSSDYLIKLNISKGWTMADYLHYYVQLGYVEYQKLQLFIKKHNIALAVALKMLMGSGHSGYTSFRHGEFKFVCDLQDHEIDRCWETVDYIKRFNGGDSYLESSKFWNAIIKLIRHPLFEIGKWRQNLSKLVSNCGPRTCTLHYTKMLFDIYNYRSSQKLDIPEDDN